MTDDHGLAPFDDYNDDLDIMKTAKFSVRKGCSPSTSQPDFWYLLCGIGVFLFDYFSLMADISAAAWILSHSYSMVWAGVFCVWSTGWTCEGNGMYQDVQ
jgi:hypothetical protein